LFDEDASELSLVRGGVEMKQRWRDLLQTWAVPPVLADEKLHEIAGCYSLPGRFYHTMDHIHDVLDTVDRLSSVPTRLASVKLASWLHDVIYDSRAQDNEERSAEYATRLCQQLSIPDGTRVASLILQTKTHIAGDDADARVLLDADLAILGADEPTYQGYAKNIRLEYAWVPEDMYCQGRRRILESFLARPKIYQLLGEREEPARRNITAEIGLLNSP